jgi:hypothetical protein
MSSSHGMYDPLRTWLIGQPGADIELSFAQVEQIIGTSLPPSAHVHRAWWANDTGGRHPIANAWLSAGWHVAHVDLAAQTVLLRHGPVPS